MIKSGLFAEKVPESLERKRKRTPVFMSTARAASRGNVEGITSRSTTAGDCGENKPGKLGATSGDSSTSGYTTIEALNTT